MPHAFFEKESEATPYANEPQDHAAIVAVETIKEIQYRMEYLVKNRKFMVINTHQAIDEFF